MTDTTLVPIHVQTSGSATTAVEDDRIEAVGIALPSIYRLFAVADDHAASQSSTDREFGEAATVSVRSSVHETERALLTALSRFGHDRVVRADPLLVTNGARSDRETPACWSFRNRAARIDPACPFVGLPYVDLGPIAEQRLGRTESDGLGADLDADRELPPTVADGAVEGRPAELLARTLETVRRTDELVDALRQSGGSVDGRTVGPRSAGDRRRESSDADRRRAPSDIDRRRGSFDVDRRRTSADAEPGHTSSDRTPDCRPSDGAPDAH